MAAKRPMSRNSRAYAWNRSMKDVVKNFRDLEKKKRGRTLPMMMAIMVERIVATIPEANTSVGGVEW